MARGLYLGIDLGGTDIKLGVCTLDGEVRARDVIPTRAELGPEATLDRIADAASDLFRAAGPAAACGVATPGPLDAARQCLQSAINLAGWTDVPVPRLLGERLGMPTLLENDANCAAWGEYRVGIGRGVRSLVLYALGTGVGGGIVLGDEVWLGAGGRAGRLGHVVVDPNGPPCGCGQRGCLEQYASATAVARSYGRGADHAGGDAGRQTGGEQSMEPPGRTRGFPGGEGVSPSPTAADAFEAARRGEPFALGVIDVACDALAAAAADILEIVQPEMIVLGGGMAAAGDLLLDRVRVGVRKRVYASSLEPVRIELSLLGRDAGWIGAALWAQRRAVAPPSEL